MNDISLRDYLTKSKSLNESERVDELFLTLGALALCGFCCAPLFNTEFFKAVGNGLGAMFGGIGAAANNITKKKEGKDKDKDDEKDSGKDSKGSKSKDSETDTKPIAKPATKPEGDTEPKAGTKLTTEQSTTMWQNVLAMAQKGVDREKDDEKKKQAQEMLNVSRACTIDKDGKPLPPEKFGERLKEVTGMSPEEYAKETGFKAPTDDEFNKIQSEMKKELEGKSDEDLKKIADDNVKKAQAAAKNIKESREKVEAAQKQLDDIKKQISELGDSKEDNEKREKLVQQSKEVGDKIVAGASIAIFGQSTFDKIKNKTKEIVQSIKSKSDKSDTKPEGEPKDDKDAKPEGEPKDDKDAKPDKEALKKKLDDRKAELKKQAEEAEKNAKDEKSKKSAAELQKKIDDAIAAAEKAADNDDEKEFDKQMQLADKLQKARQKQIEAHTVEKDEFGNVIKDEEVTDPETGEKKKVKMHVGPRGGKFYYPDGKPKDADHRIYVKEDDGSLSSWLYYKSLCLFE